MSDNSMKPSTRIREIQKEFNPDDSPLNDMQALILQNAATIKYLDIQEERIVQLEERIKKLEEIG